MGKILGLLLAVALILPLQSAIAGSDDNAVGKFRSSTIKVYSDHQGQNKFAQFKRDELATPAQILSGPSPKGFYMLRLEFKDASQKGIEGWVRKRDVKTTKRPELDVKCQTLASAGNKTTAGVRGLGGACK